MPTMIEFVCTHCAKEFSREKRQVSSSIAKGVKNYFCGRSCSVSYQNKTVGHGNARSFIEKWLEGRIKEKWPTLEVLYNDKTTIGSELDIFIKSFNLGIELQGKTHYQVIYNQEVLDRTQANDELKRKVCKEKGIELIEIDMSKMNSIKKDPEFIKIVEQVFNIIQNKIDNEKNKIISK